MEDMVHVKINGIAVEVPKGSTILEAARYAGVEIPTLCFLKDINEIGACRICVVEATGARGLVTACVYPVSEGMEVQTNTAKVQAARRTTLELILSTHEKKCLSCSRSGDCELQKMCKDYGVEDTGKYDGFKPHYELDTSAAHLVRDNNKCIRCGRCINVCAKVQAVSAICATGEGLDKTIAPASPKGLAAASCVNCGQCVAVCPVGALTEKPQWEQVKEAIADPEKFVVVQVAPAVRAALGETFEFPLGVDTEGRIAGALRKLGFDKVFDTKVGADLTIIEEANELIERIENGGVLPMLTSCCPGWIKYVEHFYPDMLDNLSSCKSPHTMFGALIKSWYAEKMGIPKEKIVTVSVMPCTAKKFEITREDECGAGEGMTETTNRSLGSIPIFWA